MGNIDRAISGVLKRKKLLGVALLAGGLLFFLTDVDETLSSFVGVSLAPLAFILMLVGVLLVFVQLARRRVE